MTKLTPDCFSQTVLNVSIYLDTPFTYIRKFSWSFPLNIAENFQGGKHWRFLWLSLHMPRNFLIPAFIPRTILCTTRHLCQRKPEKPILLFSVYWFSLRKKSKIIQNVNASPYKYIERYWKRGLRLVSTYKCNWVNTWLFFYLQQPGMAQGGIGCETQYILRGRLWSFGKLWIFLTKFNIEEDLLIFSRCFSLEVPNIFVEGHLVFSKFKCFFYYTFWLEGRMCIPSGLCLIFHRVQNFFDFICEFINLVSILRNGFFLNVLARTFLLYFLLHKKCQVFEHWSETWTTA